MPYVTTSRQGSPMRWRMSVTQESGYYFPSAEETYSWRTGRKARNSDFSNHVVQPPPALLISPNKLIYNKQLSETVKARSAYISQIGENMVGQNSAPYVQQTKFLTHDTGHSFRNVKYIHHGFGYRQVYNRGGRVDTYMGQPFIGTAAYTPPGVYCSSMLTSNQGFTRNLGPDSATLTSDQRSLFESARPDESIAGWGETIVELVSGNIPKIVTRLGRNIASGKLKTLQHAKDSVKEGGSDYLNVQFGWAPIIRDLESTIRHLLQVHDFLYSSSYRRSRATRTRDWYAYIPNAPLVGSPGVVRGFSSLAASLDVPDYFRGQGMETQRYDTRLKARFTRARPNAKANAFADKALEILQTLGVGYPSLAWDLIPYSWLVDWCLHIGKGINNYSTYSRTSGSFKTDYAYSTTRSTHTISFPGGYGSDTRFPNSWTSYSSWTALQQITISTTRDAATPFGFGVSLPNLSGSQYAILVALGLARSR